MKTEEFLTVLAADTLPRQAAADKIIRALPVALAVSAAALLLVWGVRPDLMTALTSAAAVKTLAPFALAGIALPLAFALARPGSAPWVQNGALVLFGIAVLITFIVTLSANGASVLLATLGVGSLFICFVSVPILASPILGALLWALSAGAPLKPARAGAVAGLAAGGLAAGLYSFFCTQDALLFFLPAYVCAVLLVATLGAALGNRVLRW